MDDWRSLSHVKWDCKYHVVFVPKYRRKALYGKRRRRIGPILRDVCVQRGIELLEGHAMPDHVDMVVRIPPKDSVAFAIGFVKGKSAVRIHRGVLKERRMVGMHFWATGYCVSTVGALAQGKSDEETVRKYVRDQESRDRMEDGQLELWEEK
ncbi:MAG: IS200/IS605 family transposase [Planctomycetes bacterium]|nr:IS200/IS605 family transposase [Planctomycetota bacterium]